MSDFDHYPTDNPFDKAEVAAAWLGSLEGGDPFREKNVYPGIREWGRTLPYDCTVADIGAGDGECVQLFDTKVRKIHVIEPSPLLLQAAIERQYSKRCPRIRDFSLAPADELGHIPTESVHGVLSVNVLFHLAPHTLTRALAEMQRILKPGRQAYIVTINPARYDSWRTMYDVTEEGPDWWRGILTYNGNKGEVTVPESLFYAHPRSFLDEQVALAGLAQVREKAMPEDRQTSLALILQKT